MSERFYVLEKFDEYLRTLTSLVEAMPIKRRAIEVYREKNNILKAKDVYKELEAVKAKLLVAIASVGLLFSETDMAYCTAYANKLYAAVDKFNLMAADYSKLISAIEALIKQIPQTETTNARVIGRLMNNVRTGYYPTDIEHIKLISKTIAFPSNTINAIDPCCGCGLALEKLTMGQNAINYGIEIDELRGDEAQGRLDRVGFGSFFYSRISNEAFHLMLLNPPYLSVMTEGGSNVRLEKRFLVDSMYHLMIGGVMVYIIPYYRLTADICRVICDNFTDISVYRFSDSEFAKFKQVAVFGIRRKKADGSEFIGSVEKYAMYPEQIPMLSTISEGRYALPEIEKRVDVFKGAVFNLGELQRQLKASKSIDVLFEKSKLDAMEKRPLLPLNVGQVGLIGGSGLINGYVNCENPHIIKGRIIKENKKYYNDTDSTLTETRVNKMVFNLLTPNGFKKLA